MDRAKGKGIFACSATADGNLYQTAYALDMPQLLDGLSQLWRHTLGPADGNLYQTGYALDMPGHWMGCLSCGGTLWDRQMAIYTRLDMRLICPSYWMGCLSCGGTLWDGRWQSIPETGYALDMPSHWMRCLSCGGTQLTPP